MPTSVTVAAFVFGLVLLLAAVIGKDIEIAAIKLPALSNAARVFAGILGAFFIYVGLFDPFSKPVLAPSASPTAPVLPTTSKYHSIPLDPIANDDLGAYGGALPTGNVVLGGVPFAISRAFGTQGELLKDRPTSATLPLDPPLHHPRQIRILINSGATYTAFKDRQIGTVMLRFQNGSVNTTPLIAGENIREWQFTGTDVVGTLSSSDTHEVFRVTQAGKDFAVLDMLTIRIPDEQRTSDLAAIVFTDTSQATTGSFDPGFFVVGVSVQYEP